MSSPVDIARRHQRVKEIFAAVLDTPVDGRDGVLTSLCGTDSALRNEVESLLGHVDTPAVDIAAAASGVRSAVADAVEATIADHESTVLPARIADYRILSILGRGGMGVVYLAEQESPRRTVALKVVRGSFLGRQLLRRFRREAELLGTLRHPNIAQIYAAGTAVVDWGDGAARHDGQAAPYFAMEYVRGLPITEFCDQRGLGVRQRVALLVPVCDAVQHAHEHGIVHRDLKPANVLVEFDAPTTAGVSGSAVAGMWSSVDAAREAHSGSWSAPAIGTPKILDFGIARRDPAHGGATTTFQTEVGQVVGTLPYMSPEQVSGATGAVDRRSDVYALGVILYQLLSGRLPLEFGERTIVEAVRMVGEIEPTSLGVLDRSLRGDLATIAAKCLEKDPAQRYQGAAELGADLRRFLDDRPIEARPPSTVYQIRKFARRNRGLVTGVTVAFVALMAATVVSIVLAARALEARDEARRQLAEAVIQGDRSTQSYAILQEIVAAIEPTTAGGAEPTVRDVMDRAKDRLATLDGDEAPEVMGMLLNAIGQAYRRLGDLESAESLLAGSVRNFRAAQPGAARAPILFVDALVAHADLLASSGRAAEADAERAEACRILEGALRQSDVMQNPKIQAVLNQQLGQLWWARGDLAEAADHLGRSVRLHVEQSPEGTELTAGMQSNLATLLMILGRPLEAEALFRSALAIHERLGGSEGVAAINARAGIVTALNQAGRYELALVQAQRIVDDRERLGHDAATLSVARLNLAFGLLGVGDIQTALPLLRSIVAQREAQAGPDSPDTARARVILAEALRHVGQLDEASALAEAALTAHRAAHGEANVRVGEDHLELAAIRFAQSRYAEAVESATAALRSLEAAAGSAHPLTARALRERGRAESALGRLDEAELDGAEALSRARELMPSGHPQLADTMLALATTLLRRGDATSALALTDEARAILVDALPNAPWRIAQADAVCGAGLAAAARMRRDDRSMAEATAGDALLERSIATIAEAVGSAAPAARAAEALRFATGPR